jgi:hypothetical protein
MTSLVYYFVPMAEQRQLGLFEKLGIFVTMAGFIVEGIRLAIGHTDDLRNMYVRWVFVIGCLFWAVIYQTLKDDPRFKASFGGIAIVTGMLLLYYQVTKLGETGWQKSDWVDRCLFILGSVAVLTKGLKDVWEDEGI